MFLDSEVLPDNKLWAFALDDAFFLGVLSSRAHAVWALASGGRLEDRPVYNKVCFDAFPFPACTVAQTQRIRAIAEDIDAHRKKRQLQYTDLTLTSMYNIIEKLRHGQELTDKDRGIHTRGVLSVLKKNHDDLDAAVFNAYGWPHDLTDDEILEKLVALNAERVEEERRRGVIHWLRPSFQKPALKKTAERHEPEEGADAHIAVASRAAAEWPADFPKRLAATRALISDGALWNAAQVSQAFGGAPEMQVIETLESLEATGRAIADRTNGTVRWRSTDMLAATRRRQRPLAKTQAEPPARGKRDGEKSA